MNELKYRMQIQWSEEDNCFLVALPDFPGQQWSTHGDTYEEAVTNGKEVLEMLVEVCSEEGTLPAPKVVSV